MSRVDGRNRKRNQLLAAAVGGAIGSVLAGGAASAGTYTLNKTTGGPYDWNDPANWTASPAGYPQLGADIANVTSNITTNVVLNLNVPITIGVLNLGDTSNAFTIQTGTAGSLTFNNGAARAEINITNTPATGHLISTDLLLGGDLWVGHAGNKTATPELTIGGTIKSGASSGVQTLSFGSKGIDRYAANQELATVDASISDGTSGGAMAVAQRVGSGTTSGITTLTGSNTYTGGSTVVLGTLKGTQTGGTPFGTGTINAHGGILALAPTGSGADVALGGANLAAGTKFNYGGGGSVSLNKGTQNSLTFTAGNAGAAVNSVLVRQNFGTLILTPSAVDTLGVTEKLIVNGGVATNGGIVSPTVVAQASPASANADFVVHDTTNGFQRATAQYTGRTGTFTAAAGEISDVTASATANTASALAVRVGAGLPIGSGQTLTVGNGSGPAGVILNGGNISAGNSASLLQFDGEGAVYLSSARTISAPIAGSNGLTKFGPGTLTLSSTANSITGGIRINNGQVTVTGGPGALGPASNAITLMPLTTLNIANSGLNGANFQHDMILNGGRSVTASNYSTEEPVITSGGSDLATARILSGVISSGTAVTTTTPGGVTFAGSGSWTRIQGDNTFTGQLRNNGAKVIAEHNNAFGAGTNTPDDGVMLYVQSAIGVRGGVTISNEYANLGNGHLQADGYGNLHAFPNVDAGGSQVAEWGGTVAWGNVNNFGAEAGTTLRLSGPLRATFNGIRKVGLGTVEITSSNTHGNFTAVSAVANVQAGTLRLRNTDPAGSATGYSPIEVQSGATLDGTGYAWGTVMVRAGGSLKPGASIGTLTITGGGATGGQTWVGGVTTNMNSGSVVMEAGSHLVMELDSTSADQLALTRAATNNVAMLGAPIEFVIDPSFAPPSPLVLDLVTARTIDYQGLTGDLPPSADNLDEQLAAVSASYTRVTAAPASPYEYRYQLISNPNTEADILRVEFAAVPEPSALGLLAVGALPLMRRRRRA